jgi:pyrroline-5-carboxylate reductase
MHRLTQQPRIAFIGGGNMGSALIGGLVADGIGAQQIVVAEPDETKRAALAARFGVRCASDGAEAVRGADVVVLAIKPQAVEAVASKLAGAVQRETPLVISVAAGIRECDLRQWLGEGVTLVRSMPNTPAMIQAGATVLHAGPQVSAAQRDLAESILRAVGLTLWVEDEALMDAVTAVSGSGPAYFFYVMEALQQAGAALGLAPETARLLTLQTAMGAAKMALESQEPPAELRRRVTSPGGTTERALEILEAGNLASLFEKALAAARDRSIELSEQLGNR